MRARCVRAVRAAQGVPVLEVLLGNADVELLIAGGLVDLDLPVERAAALQLSLGAQNVDRAWE
jgi:hypothetical protein